MKFCFKNKILFFQGELAPLSCRGQHFDPVKIPLVTLIDSLDTLAIMQNYSEFCNAINVIQDHFGDNMFDFDVNVSVFEITIRILGGLLSAHLLAVDEIIGIYVCFI